MGVLEGDEDGTDVGDNVGAAEGSAEGNPDGRKPVVGGGVAHSTSCGKRSG